VALLEERVEVGEEALAELDHLAADRLVGLAEGPRLLAAGAYGGVVAAERLEDAHLRPAGEELAVAVPEEAPMSTPAHATPERPRFWSWGMLIQRCSHHEELSPSTASRAAAARVAGPRYDERARRRA
jgi:hypothetical protein